MAKPPGFLMFIIKIKLNNFFLNFAKFRVKIAKMSLIINWPKRHFRINGSIKTILAYFWIWLYQFCENIFWFNWISFRLFDIIFQSSSDQRHGPLALIIAPTKELASQIFALLERLTGSMAFIQSFNLAQYIESHDETLENEVEKIPRKITNLKFFWRKYEIIFFAIIFAIFCKFSELKIV